MKIKKLEGIIPSVNYHLWEPCNMRCKFCFATFQDAKIILPKGHLPKEESLELVREIAAIGFKKITFAGGEPRYMAAFFRQVKIGVLTLTLEKKQ